MRRESVPLAGKFGTRFSVAVCMRWSVVPVVFASLTGLVGCGQSGTHAMRSVTGEVRMADQPAATGVVRFVPIGEDGKGSQDGRPYREAAIANGRYEVPRAMGLSDGPYRVEVLVHRKTGKRVKVPGVDVEMDEVVLINDPAFSGPGSPLRFEAGQRLPSRFDIEVPAKNNR